MRDKFVELGCEFMGPEVCEELADEEGYEIAELENQHFDEDTE